MEPIHERKNCRIESHTVYVSRAIGEWGRDHLCLAEADFCFCGDGEQALSLSRGKEDCLLHQEHATYYAIRNQPTAFRAASYGKCCCRHLFLCAFGSLCFFFLGGGGGRSQSLILFMPLPQVAQQHNSFCKKKKTKETPQQHKGY